MRIPHCNRRHRNDVASRHLLLAVIACAQARLALKRSWLFDLLRVPVGRLDGQYDHANGDEKQVGNYTRTKPTLNLAAMRLFRVKQATSLRHAQVQVFSPVLSQARKNQQGFLLSFVSVSVIFSIVHYFVEVSSPTQ